MIAEMFGSNVFHTEEMARRLTAAQFAEYTGGKLSMETADAVAEAMKNWALERGATHYCHWFQPLTGATAEKHDSFLAGQENGKALLRLTGKQLIMGESDASSFPTGGLRGTAYARGYTAWDMTSPVFIKEETAGKILCIPTVFLSYDGTALDLKTPLLRSMEALERQGRRLTGLFGKPEKVFPLVGPEQEYFLVDRKAYGSRRDLRYCGRTLFGAAAPKGQELDDQYFGAIPKRAGAFMQALNEELWKLGVMAAAQHNEVAPGQHELAVRHCVANVAVDQNQLIMETMKRLAPEHGLVCLLHEKPFAGVNGSGKHNNWSLCTESGENLLKAKDDARFLLVLGCILQAVDRHADLLRLSAANVGNDARLGGQEAPVAVVSVYLGEPLQTLLEGAGSEKKRTMDAGLNAVPSFRHDRADRNRTAAMAFTGNKFEFRMVGSSDSVAMANTVLYAAVAESFCQAADALEGAADMEGASRAYARALWEQHKRVVFNGDCYSAEWAREAERRGLPNLPSMVDAVSALLTEETVSMFESFRILNRLELESRAEVLYETYAKHIRIESRVMLHMVAKDYMPAVIRYMGILDRSEPVQRHLYERLASLLAQVDDLRRRLEERAGDADSKQDAAAVAKDFRERVVPVMERLRGAVDALEMLVGRDCWPVPTYGDLMFET
jgi:glutamine synthetase